jgi:fibronectin-binding autotransporter adhesin
MNPATLLTGLFLATLAVGTVRSQTVIVSDNYNVSTATTGFALDTGVNFGINPPIVTRLTGTAAANLRYLQTAVGKPATVFGINASRLRVATDGGIGRFTLSGNGSAAFDFSSALATLGATPGNPAKYEIRIKMRNDATSTARFSFGLGTAEGDAGTWDFGVQLYRAGGSDTFYTIQKRIDTASSGVGDLNATLGTTAPGTHPSLINFLIEVTDAGAETTAYSSRVRVSLDNGTTWIYDTQADPTALPNGWRLDGNGRYFMWDQAGNSSGNVFYDDFSVTWISGPPLPEPGVAKTWTGLGGDDNWNTGANWGGVAPTNTDLLVFSGATRQINTNDITGLTVPLLMFNNGGFTLYGNVFTNTSTVSNLAGVNILGGDLAWSSTDAKFWSLAAGSELQLANTTSVDIGGDHALFGGGTLRVKGTMNIGQASTANPAFILNEAKHIVDGGTFASRGGYRIGSQAAGTGAQTILTNGATINLTVSGANLRVGDSANPVTARLIIDNSTLTMAGGSLAIPYATGATGEVSQVGGLVSGSILNFSQNGAGLGTYTLKDGTIEAIQLKKTSAGGVARMYFDNAVLRTAGSASNAFFTGLNLAEIQAGGLTLDAQSDVVIGQVLSGAGALVKSNFATVTLTGANTYSGNTLVQDGKLVLPTIQTNATTIQVADGKEFGVVVRSQGSTLSATALNFAGASFGTLSFDLGTFGSPTAPIMRVSSLSVSGPVTINVANGIQLSTGQIVLVDYDGAISGGFQFTLAGLPSGVSATLVNNVANSSIDLNITAVPGLRWTGAVNGEWDYATLNWFDKQTASTSAYTDGPPVEFLDGATNNIVSISGFPTTSIITVSNNTQPYVWANGAITATSLKKLGSGSLTRAETSADLINGIELNAGSYIASNAFDATFTTVLTDNAPATGLFVKSGSSIMTISSASGTYDGSVVVQEGTLKLAATASLGSTNGATTIANGATLDVNDTSVPHEPVIVSGTGVSGLGAVIDSTAGGAVANNLTDVTMTGDTTFGAPNGGRWDIRVRASTGPGPGLRGNGFNLTKVGSGFVSIACQRNIGAGTPYWQMNLGDIVINEGTLALAESLSLGNPLKTITINSGAALQLFDLGITNPIVRNITMTDARLNASGGSTDTNVITGAIDLTGAISVRPDQAILILSGTISGSGSLSMSAVDPGRVYLNGVNTYTGDTTVTNGTLGGVGVIAGNLVMLGGTNSPGMSLGTLTVNGNATLAGTTFMELDRSQSPNSDRLVVGGTLSFGGVLQVVVAGSAPQGGDVYQLFNKGSGAAFTSIVLPILPVGLSWDTSNLLANGSISVSGTTAPLTITNVTASAGNLIANGTGGVAGNTYTVVTATNVALPAANWTPVATNVFGPGGVFSFTNSINPALPANFFRVWLP